ncbi:MAG: dihydrolipoyl dehydrogenase, partial [Defluviitaleaceae bacterium]|nr:dihydrolipoyl dehydrogenase [Defluviitaleaceae bacterium]
GGPAGYSAAERAAFAGMETILFEKKNLGGVCLNEGCIPSKSLLYSAKIYENAKNGSKYGVHAREIFLNHSEVVARKNRVVKKLTGGIAASLESRKVTVVNGEAKIEGKNENGGFDVICGKKTHTAKRLLIAAGSEPILPPIDGLRESLASGVAITNREILSLETVPKKLVVVGGGVIGLEMAGYYATAGSSVTVIEMLGGIGGSIDSEIAAVLQKNLEAKGIVFCLDSKVVSIGNTVRYERGGEQKTVEADKVLVSIGRRPVVQGVGLENIGLECAARIETDRFMQTGVPGVYAAGDVTGKIMLAHVAYRQAETAVAHMCGCRSPIRYDAVPSVIYTLPEVGSVGETERTALEKGMEAETVKLPMQYSGRYVAENEQGDGICKLIVEKSTRRIIGCHVIGSYASEIILSAAILIDMCQTVGRAKEIIFPHPTVGEIIKEAIFKFNS